MNRGCQNPGIREYQPLCSCNPLHQLGCESHTGRETLGTVAGKRETLPPGLSRIPEIVPGLSRDVPGGKTLTTTYFLPTNPLDLPGFPAPAQTVRSARRATKNSCSESSGTPGEKSWGPLWG